MRQRKVRTWTRPALDAGRHHGVVNRYFLWVLVDAKGVKAGPGNIRVSRVCSCCQREDRELTSYLSSTV